MLPRIGTRFGLLIALAPLAGCASARASIEAVPAPAVEVCAIEPQNRRVTLNPARIERVEAIVRKLVDSGAVPGAVLEIEHGGRKLVSFAYGLADRETGNQIRGDSLFRLYSMTKPITSVAIMRLVEVGQIGLDDPVSRYIPAFANARAYDQTGTSAPLKRPITIRDLLRHTAGIAYRTETDPVGALYTERGIPAGPGVDHPPTDSSPPVDTLAALVDRVATTPLKTQPGAGWSYGNSTDVLGRVLEVVIEKPLAEALADLVLIPVGMDGTSFQTGEVDRDRMTAAYINSVPKAAGQGVLASVDLDTIVVPPLILADPAEGSIFSNSPQIAYGGAGLIGPVGDYLRFTSMLRAGGTINGTRILQPETIDQMRSNQLQEDARNESATLDGLGFGLGFATRMAPTATTPVFPHCGYFWGGAASTFFWIDPAGDVSGVLMTQVFGGDTSSYWLAIMREIYDGGQ